MSNLSASVGRGGVNRANDVRLVQTLLNQNAYRMSPYTPLAVDGMIGPKTIGAIEQFQRNVLRYNNVDGRVDPGYKTIQELSSGARGGMPGPAPTPSPTPGGAPNTGSPKDPVGNLNLVVTRFQATDKSVIGTMSVNGTNICYTLEEAWRDNQKGHSCVGLGTYTAFLRYTSSKSKREWCFQLHDANGRTAIQIHIGNKPEHTEGCVLVGTTYSQDFVGGSTDAYQKLQDFIFGPGFTRQQIRDAAPKHGTIQVTFVDKTPGLTGRV